MCSITCLIDRRNHRVGQMLSIDVIAGYNFSVVSDVLVNETGPDY
jgi:hypothetical protein